MGESNTAVLDPIRFKDTEIVIGLVAPLGTDLEPIVKILRNALENTFRYNVEYIELSQLIKKHYSSLNSLKEEPPFEYFKTYIEGGSLARKKANDGGILALEAIREIHDRRKVDNLGDKRASGRTAYIIKSLKHPSEAEALRFVYGPGFFLLGVHATPEDRREFLCRDKGMTEEEATFLMETDESESDPLGQQTRDTFELCDVFVWAASDSCRNDIRRFLNLVFGSFKETPTRDELSMFMAYSASLRSGDLSRQVGAAIVSRDNDVIAIGTNDAPQFGGGLYWPEEGKRTHRDLDEKKDSNALERAAMIAKIMRATNPELKDKDDDACYELGKTALLRTGILELTEYGRSVHAEMEALLACGRCGVSPRNGTLFCTTFPCHNCAKHIIGAGITRVVYIEPYPKSRAVELHKDAFEVSLGKPGKEKRQDKVRCEPFQGIGPRRFIDLFALRSYTGTRRKRSVDGKLIKWDPKDSEVKVPLALVSYLDVEKLIKVRIEDAEQKKKEAGP